MSSFAYQENTGELAIGSYIIGLDIHQGDERRFTTPQTQHSKQLRETPMPPRE